MKKGKDLRLVNIYIKIHNKKNLTMDDLAYLAQYNPECFKKTCDNLIYKVPETQALVKPPEEPSLPAETQSPAVQPPAQNLFEMTAEEKAANQQMILQFLESLKKVESESVNALQSIDIAQVKELVGNLFMEHLFPHNDLPGYFDVTKEEEAAPRFNMRV